MRHRVAYRKLGRVTEHRLALLRNQAEALLRHERIRTTVPKAKELRPFVERLITIAKRGLAEGAATGRTLQARRLVLRDIPSKEVVGKLFETIAPRFAARPGGYTRILRLGYRSGDSAALAQVELVGSEFTPKAAAETPERAPAAPPSGAGVGRRLRAAAERLRRRGSAEADPGKPEAPAEAATRGRGRHKTFKKAPAKGSK